jgi:hypothetical protein
LAYQQVRESLRSLPAHTLTNMQINIRRCAYPSVPQEFLGHLQVMRYLIQQRTCGVTECVESILTFLNQDSRRFERWIKNLLAEKVRIVRASV